MESGCSSSNTRTRSSCVNVNPGTYDRAGLPIQPQTLLHNLQPGWLKHRTVEQIKKGNEVQEASMGFAPCLLCLHQYWHYRWPLSLLERHLGHRSHICATAMATLQASLREAPTTTQQGTGGALAQAVTVRLQISPCTARFCCKNFSISF